MTRISRWWAGLSRRGKVIVAAVVAVAAVAVAAPPPAATPGETASPAPIAAASPAPAAPTPSATPTAAATPSAAPTESAAPSAAPTPPPTAAPSFATFGDGTWEVGADIGRGTYRLREPAASCYWARLSGFGGSLGEIKANDLVSDAYAVVTIARGDAGFESNGCGEWTTDLSQIQADRQNITWDGTYVVKTDILPGQWRSGGGGETCYWARLRGFSGEISDVIANDLVSGGRTIVTIGTSDVGFVTKGCGSWGRG